MYFSIHGGLAVFDFLISHLLKRPLLCLHSVNPLCESINFLSFPPKILLLLARILPVYQLLRLDFKDISFTCSLLDEHAAFCYQLRCVSHFSITFQAFCTYAASSQHHLGYPQQLLMDLPLQHLLFCSSNPYENVYENPPLTTQMKPQQASNSLKVANNCRKTFLEGTSTLSRLHWYKSTFSDMSTSSSFFKIGYSAGKLPFPLPVLQFYLFMPLTQHQPDIISNNIFPVEIYTFHAMYHSLPNLLCVDMTHCVVNCSGEENQCSTRTPTEKAQNPPESYMVALFFT